MKIKYYLCREKSEDPKIRKRVGKTFKPFMNMEKFNNHGLDAINSRVCFALDDFEDNEEIQGQTNSNVKYKGGMKEYVELVPLLGKLCRGEELQDEEEKKLLKLMKEVNDIINIDMAESAISQYCNIVDSNKSFEGLYLTNDSIRKEKKEFCIRFAKEDELPKAEVGDLPSMEYFGYYDSKENQIILCPERIKEATELFKGKGVQITQQVTTSQQVTTFYTLYGMVFIHALSHAVLDCTNKMDEKGSIVKCDNLYQKINSDLLSEEKVMLYKFMEESVATIMTLYYYSKVNQQYEDVLREWLSYLPQEYKIGLEQFDMLKKGNDFVENYCAAWRGRKKALKSYIVGVRKMNY